MDGPWMDTVTVASTYTETEGGSKVFIHGRSMDGHSNCSIHGYLVRGGRVARCSSMDGPWMNTVTLASMDTWTECGSKVSIHGSSMDGP